MESTLEVKPSQTNTITQWVNCFSDELFSYALHSTSDKELSEDLVQETFLSAHQNFNNFEFKSEPRTWLFAILKNKISDHFRKSFRNKTVNAVPFTNFFDKNDEWRFDQLPEMWSMHDEEHLLDNPEFNSTLSHCLEKLPKDWKNLIMMKFLNETDGKNICQELGISATNYWQILHRTKLQLRKCLDLNWFKK